MFGLLFCEALEGFKGTVLLVGEDLCGVSQLGHLAIMVARFGVDTQGLVKCGVFTHLAPNVFKLVEIPEKHLKLIEVDPIGGFWDYICERRVRIVTLGIIKL